MYSGKSTLGRELAQYLSDNCGIATQFVDTDQAFEERYHLTIADCFRKYGEPMFRKLESTVLRELSDSSQQSAVSSRLTAVGDVDSQSAIHNTQITIVSTGGGTPCFNDNMQWMLNHGLTVHLRLSEEGILRRMAVSRKPRPILAAMPPDERAEYVHNQLQQRQPYYQQAHLTIDVENPDIAAIARNIAEWFSSRQNDSNR